MLLYFLNSGKLKLCLSKLISNFWLSFLQYCQVRTTKTRIFVSITLYTRLSWAVIYRPVSLESFVIFNFRGFLVKLLFGHVLRGLVKLKNANFPVLLEIFIQFWFIAFLYPWGVIKVENWLEVRSRVSCVQLFWRLYVLSFIV